MNPWHHMKWKDQFKTYVNEVERRVELERHGIEHDKRKVGKTEPSGGTKEGCFS